MDIEDERQISERFQNLPLSDNFMFGEVMRHPEICRLFLEALLGFEIARIEVAKEVTISDTLGFHGIRLDVYAREADKMYNVEMFSSLKYKPDLRRARYYQDMMDRRVLETGKDYVDLPESYVIFVCNFSYFETGQAIDRRKMVIEGREDVEYDDGSHVYILNSRYTVPNASQPVLEFLDCIQENNVDRGYDSDLMKLICPAIKEVRGSADKQEEYMVLEALRMDLLREGREEGRKEGRAEGIQIGEQRGEQRGIQIGRMETAKNLLAMGLAPEVVAQGVGRTLEQIKELQNK